MSTRPKQLVNYHSSFLYAISAGFEAMEAPKRFYVQDGVALHQRLEIETKLGHRLACSHLIPEKASKASTPIPCIVYAHSHGGSCLEGRFLIDLLVPKGISVFLFDFSGSGQSTGSFVTLGSNEQEDLVSVIEHLSKQETVSIIGLWGRSMGAASAIISAFKSKSPKIKVMVLDSPFDSLRNLISLFIDSTVKILPNFLISPACDFAEKLLMEKAGIDAAKVVPINHVPHCSVPSFFLVGEKDEITSKSLVESIYAKYKGKKEIEVIPGTHVTRRKREHLKKALEFLENHIFLRENSEEKNINSKSSQKASEDQLDQNSKDSVKENSLSNFEEGAKGKNNQQSFEKPMINNENQLLKVPEHPIFERTNLPSKGKPQASFPLNSEKPKESENLKKLQEDKPNTIPFKLDCPVSKGVLLESNMISYNDPKNKQIQSDLNPKKEPELNQKEGNSPRFHQKENQNKKQKPLFSKKPKPDQFPHQHDQFPHHQHDQFPSLVPQVPTLVSEVQASLESIKPKEPWQASGIPATRKRIFEGGYDSKNKKLNPKVGFEEMLLPKRKF